MTRKRIDSEATGRDLATARAALEAAKERITHLEAEREDLYADAAMLENYARQAAAAILARDPDAEDLARVILGDASVARIQSLLRTPDGGVAIQAARGWPSRVFCEAFRAMFVDPRFPNYVEVTYLYGQDEGYVVRMQRREGKTPNEMQREAERERDKLRARVEQLEAVECAVRVERKARAAWLASLPEGSCGNPPPRTLLDAEEATGLALDRALARE